MVSSANALMDSHLRGSVMTSTAGVPAGSSLAGVFDVERNR